MKVILYLSAFTIMASCGRKPSVDPVQPSIHLQFEEAEDVDIPSMTENLRFVKLDNSPDAYFTDIAKLSYKNGNFYLMETFSQDKGVLVFDEDGVFIRKVGEIGEGPEMMRRPTDFEVLGGRDHRVFGQEKNLKDLPQGIQDHLAEEGHVLVIHDLKVMETEP